MTLEDLRKGPRKALVPGSVFHGQVQDIVGIRVGSCSSGTWITTVLNDHLQISAFHDMQIPCAWPATETPPL